MNGENSEFSQKFNLNLSPESRCLKNGNTDDNIGTCNWRGSRHGNSIWVKVNGVEVSSWRAASHSLKQVFAFEFPDGFDKSMRRT